MGLIERAGAVLEPESDGPNAAANDLAIVRPEAFDIDFGALAAHGYYNPADRSSRLSLELRAAKRALLRRTGLRNAAGERKLVRKGGRQRNLVLFTSARPGEGKTFCAINLALSLACEDDVEVLLVDADAPRPKVRALFGLGESRGLSDCLADPDLVPEGLFLKARQAPLCVLPEGRETGRPAELLAGPDAQRFFTALSTAAPGRLVLIDAPPMLATAEAAMLARHVDEVVFVVQAGETPAAAVASALDEVLEANQNVSLLLNRCLIGEAGSYYGSYEDYDRNAAPAGLSKGAGILRGSTDG